MRQRHLVGKKKRCALFYLDVRRALKAGRESRAYEGFLRASVISPYKSFCTQTISTQSPTHPPGRQETHTAPAIRIQLDAVARQDLIQERRRGRWGVRIRLHARERGRLGRKRAIVLGGSDALLVVPVVEAFLLVLVGGAVDGGGGEVVDVARGGG